MHICEAQAGSADQFGFYSTGMLEREPADALAAGHLRALLAFLCDEALDAEGFREALAARLESADEARAHMRKATQEEKRKLNVSPSPVASRSNSQLLEDCWLRFGRAVL